MHFIAISYQCLGLVSQILLNRARIFGDGVVSFKHQKHRLDYFLHWGYFLHISSHLAVLDDFPEYHGLFSSLTITLTSGSASRTTSIAEDLPQDDHLQSKIFNFAISSCTSHENSVVVSSSFLSTLAMRLCFLKLIPKPLHVRDLVLLP